ncbi:MAG: hypothetical protein E4H14_10300 [Candidatus Thorarchaeota archaeon]|nr:MAG: hypothetical protein E4H14_10300 [Candidatus Thorarchaeota archaeon]
MKRNQLTKTLIVIGFLSLLVVSAAGSAGAFASQTNECGTSGCHDTLGTLTLVSNSTSVTATTGDSFVLVIQAGNGAEWIKVISGWEDNAQFSVSQIEIEDGSANDTDAVTGAISVTLTFIPLSAGTHTIRIWTAAAGDLASSLDITVTVTGESITTTTTPPPTVDLLGTWRILMIIVPVATGAILLILGIVAFKRNE